MSTARGPDPCAGLDAMLEELRGVSFRQHIKEAFLGTFIWWHYVELLVDVFQRFADGTLLLEDGSRADKLFVAMPNQTGKSTIVELWISWMMRRFQGLIVGAAMHKDTVTLAFAEQVRDFHIAACGPLKIKAIHDWKAKNRSRMWAMTKKGSQTGLPAHCLVADDLLPDQETAHDPRICRKDAKWLGGVWLKRFAKNRHPKLQRKLQVVIGNRLSQVDGQSRLLSFGDFYCVILPFVYRPDKWPIDILVGPFPIPNLKQPDKPWRPRNCAIHPDWRKYGEGLEEKNEDLTAKAFEAQRVKNGGETDEMLVSAMLQQCPSPASGGGVCRAVWIKKRKEDLPESSYLKTSRGWDTATKEGGSGSAWASTKIGRTFEGAEVIRHGCQARKDPEGGNQLLAAMMILDGPRVHIVLPLPKATGSNEAWGYTQYLRRVAGWAGVACPPIAVADVSTSKPVGDRKDGEESYSAKWWRFAGGPESFVAKAKPVQWNEDQGTVQIYGTVTIVTAHWRPSFRDLIPDFEERAGRHPELLKIEQLGLAATGQMSDARCEELNVDPDPFWVRTLEDFDGINPFGGGRWDGPDSCADAHRHVMQPIYSIGSA